MAPDIEELIKKINTLTLDKNRLRQKLTQLTQNSQQQQQLLASTNNNHSRETNLFNQQSSTNSPQHSNSIDTSSTTTFDTGAGIDLQNKNLNNNNNNNTNNNNNNHNKFNLSKLNKSSSSDLLINNKLSSTNIAGIECSTSCEDDLLFLNDLYKKRLDEYNDNWDYLQSKCVTLLAELNALQEHYSILKKEKLDLQEKLNNKSDECEQIKSELQTVVLNYETQLSAMSDHLSTITSQINLDN